MNIKALTNHAQLTIQLIESAAQKRGIGGLKKWEKRLFKSACRAFEIEIPPHMKE